MSVNDALVSERLKQLADLARRMGHATDLESALGTCLQILDQAMGFRPLMILADAGGDGVMTTIASRGYGSSGVGAEVPPGEGAIGVAAQRKVAVRIASLRQQLNAARALQLRRRSHESVRTVQLPGLVDANCQMAVPLCCGARVLGVLFTEHAGIAPFTEADEHTFLLAGTFLTAALERFGHGDEPNDDAIPAPATLAIPTGPSVAMKYYASDNCVFLDGEYLIKGLPGRILWKLLSEWRQTGRSEFTNRELRLDASLKLPAVRDNLEARLILLRSRLEERADTLRIEKAGRGRFRLIVHRPLQLELVSDT